MSESKNKKCGFFRTFFMIIGILATVLIALIVAVIVIKPYNIDPMQLFKQPVVSNYDHPYLNTQQENLLKSVGVDPADIPTKITPEQEQCAVKVLGAERVKELENGATLGVTDILKLKSCAN